MPTNRFQFGNQTITTRVSVMVPRAAAAPQYIDVTAAMDDRPRPRAVPLDVLSNAPAAAATAEDPFAEVEV
jgi:hypothetical protein